MRPFKALATEVVRCFKGDAPEAKHEQISIKSSAPGSLRPEAPMAIVHTAGSLGWLHYWAKKSAQ
jgi:hypothetical protein